MSKVILASKSPRRCEILSRVGLSFEIMPADVDETVSESMSAEEAVAEISRRKAEAVRARVGDDRIVIACDTMVSVDGRIFGKPVDRADADRMLHILSGRTHQVFSGLTVCRGDQMIRGVERSDVVFRSPTDAEIDAYLATGEPFDKAGAYGIQGIGGLLVDSIHGDYYNIVGLPLCRLMTALRAFGVDLLIGVNGIE